MATRGRPAKPIEQHLAEGTYRIDRHGPLADLSAPFYPKPAFRSEAQRKRTPVPVEWRRIWQKRGVWGPNDEAAIEQGCWFDPPQAQHFRGFCHDLLCLWEGKQWAGKPFDLMPWQWYDVFARIFGWFRWDPEWGCPVRRFDRAYVEVPKKNGKSPMAASVGCYMLAADGETGGKVFSAASARDQAAIVHGHAMAMIQASPRLMERCKINRSTHTIVFEPPELFQRAGIARAPAQNVYASISSEAGPQEGKNANCIIADELHVWQGRKLWDALEYAFEARVSPLLFCITTAGEDEQSVCYEQHEYSEAVRAGHVRDSGFLGYIRSAEKDDGIGDEVTWRKANPSLGTTITLGRFRDMYRAAQKKGAAAVASFCRYRLNKWGMVANPMIDPEAWDDCYEPFTIEDLAGRLCCGGLDMSKSEDMTAFALMFRDGESYRQLCWFWLPEQTYEKNLDRVDYRQWIDEEWLAICPGSRIDEKMVEDKIVWASEQFNLNMVHFDPWRAHGIAGRLEQEHGIEVVEFPQTITRFAEPTAEYETLIKQGRLHHNGNGCLTWQSRHVKTKPDQNKNERPVKPIRGDVRTIDGIVAGIMALALAMGDEGLPSAYETEALTLV